MKSFLEYLKEQEEHLAEDAVMPTGTAPVTGAEVSSPETATNVKTADVVSPNLAVGLSDNSVLGNPTKCRAKDKGFFGKDDFRIPKNVLSGEVETLKI